MIHAFYPELITAWINTANSWAHLIKRDVLALWIAARDSRTPNMAKLFGGIVAANAVFARPYC